MATFEIIEGAPGQGKSLYTARLAMWLLNRNKKWHAKGNKLRIVCTNMRFSKELENEYPNAIKYWTDSAQLCELRDCDIIWDEIATELDGRNFANLSTEIKRFLSQYRKRGIDIYANTQDFSMIDARARLMISNVKTLSKIIGSSDISTTKPPPKTIWGLVMIRDVENYRETDPEKKVYGFLPNFFMISKELVDVYDTRQDIKIGEPPPLKHEERVCEHYENPKSVCYHSIKGKKVLHT